MMPQMAPDDKQHLLDTRGLMCPEPLRLAQLRLQELLPGAILRVLADDPAAPIDFEFWCLRRRHEWLGSKALDGGWDIRLRKAGD